jgi:hypothetical protein
MILKARNRFWKITTPISGVEVPRLTPFEASSDEGNLLIEKGLCIQLPDSVPPKMSVSKDATNVPPGEGAVEVEAKEAPAKPEPVKLVVPTVSTKG